MPVVSIDEDLLRRLPLPLAQLYRRAHNAKGPQERHHAAYYLWESSLKLLGAAAVVEYAELGDRDSELADRLQNLARPSLGHWWEFVRRLVPVLANRGDRGFAVVRDLLLGKTCDGLPHAAGLDAVLVQALEGRATAGARATVRLAELFDRLVRYRNREIGHGAVGQRPAAFYEQVGRALLAAAPEVLGRLDVLAGRRPLYVADVRRHASGRWLVERYELAGETARRLESLDLPDGEAVRRLLPDRVYLESVTVAPGERAEGDGPASGDRGPRAVPLHPLLVYDAEAGEALFLNARRGRQRIAYLSYSTGREVERTDLADEQRALLARVLHVPVEPPSVAEWAARSRAEEQAGGAPDEAPVAPRRLGEFELLSELGRGGMGVVYRAWQPSLGRQVAVKALYRLGDPKAEARFAREIRALGHVEHPHLVRIFTSGSEAEQWFYAMELVEGATLAAVCDKLGAGPRPETVDTQAWQRVVSTVCAEARQAEKPLSEPATVGRPVPSPAPADPEPDLGRPSPRVGQSYVRHVVELARQAAEAAHALHEHGILHRDIKPGNVMVTADGAQAVLMDLGLAQLSDEVGGRLTKTRQFVGTLRYASPEQVLAVGGLDRRSDVYNLGATLWELLTLRPMFGATDQTPTPELMRRIQVEEPERPRKYHKGLSRDLEAIVLRCLEKDAGARYPTARDLARDLGRYQAGEPVQARPIGRVRRAYRWCRRNPAPAGLLAVLAGVILGSLSGLTVLYLNARHQEAGQRAVTRFYEDHVLVAARPTGWAGGLSKDVTLKQALDHAVPEIDKDFSGQPELEATVRHTLGMTYWYLADFDAAGPLLERAYDIRLRVLGPDDPDTLTSLHDLAMERWKQGRLDDAVTLARQALARRRRVLTPEHEDTLFTQLNLGLFLSEQHEYREAEELLTQAIASCKRTLPPLHHHTLYGQNDLATVLWATGREDECLELERQTLDGRRRSLGPRDPDTLRSMDNLAGHLLTAGQLEAAESLCREAYELRRAVLGDEHEESLWGLDTLTNIVVCRQKWADAEELLRHRLDVCERLRRADDREIPNSRTVLGVFLRHRGKTGEASRLLQPAVQACRQALDKGRVERGATDASTLQTQDQLAWLMENEGQLKEAEALYRQTLDTQSRTCGLRHKDTLVTRINLAAMLLNQGDKVGAEGSLRELLDNPGLLRTRAEVPFGGDWSGRWKNSGGQIGHDSLSIHEKSDGTVTGVWSGYVRFHGQRLPGNLLVMEGLAGNRFYRAVATWDGEKLGMNYSAAYTQTGELYSGRCEFTKAK